MRCVLCNWPNATITSEKAPRFVTQIAIVHVLLMLLPWYHPSLLLVNLNEKKKIKSLCATITFISCECKGDSNSMNKQLSLWLDKGGNGCCKRSVVRNPISKRCPLHHQSRHHHSLHKDHASRAYQERHQGLISTHDTCLQTYLFHRKGVWYCNDRKSRDRKVAIKGIAGMRKMCTICINNEGLTLVLSFVSSTRARSCTVLASLEEDEVSVGR